jgi:L-arabinose isomerase
MQIATPEIWFVCGSQHLYGPGPLRQVAAHADEIAGALAQSKVLPLKIVAKPLVTTADEILSLCVAASSDDNCAGIILWMHTFSPSKMWIRGFNALRKPLLHLHTQFNRELPWDAIDMDFMNLNQSAHGDREAGFIHTRMRLARKVVVGHWSDAEVHDRLGAWMRAARAWHDWQGAKFCRFGDNMRQVAVTEGDKVAAEMKLGFATNGYGVGDLVQSIERVKDAEADELCAEWERLYDVAPELRRGGARRESALYAARQELGLRAFLSEGGFKGYTDTFEDLHGLKQLPGVASQRLMADGYGFGGEGDWKTAALVRAMKVMADGLPQHRRGQAATRDPSARHRRQRRSGAVGVRCACRRGAQRQLD